MSFWVNCVMVWVPTSLALGALMTWMSVKGELLRTGSITVLIGWPLMLALMAWGTVGAWRAANAHASKGRAVVWARATKIVVVTALLTTWASTAINLAPNVVEYIQLAQGDDPYGHVQAVVSADGRRLQLTGTLGAGDGARVAQLLASAPNVSLIELDSPGGRLHEASQIAEAIRGRARQTRVNGACENACALILMAGTSRQVMPNARLGFHRAAGSSFNPLFMALANRELAAIYRRAGLTETVIIKTLSTPPSRMWRPDPDELPSGGLINIPKRPLDIDLPAPEGALPSDYAEALSANQVWYSLEKRYPGSIAAAAVRMHKSRVAKGVDEEVLTSGQAVAEALMPQLLSNASPWMQERYLSLLAEQLVVARESRRSACGEVLGGDVKAHRGLPAVLAAKEAAWVMDVATEPVRDTPMRRLTALEMEVIGRSIGAGAPAMLAGLWRRGGSGQQNCDRVDALFARIARLPPGERRLAVRLIFDRPR